MDIFPVRHSTGTKTQFEPNQMQSSYNSYKETLHTETILNLTKLKPYFRSLLQHTVRKWNRPILQLLGPKQGSSIINHVTWHKKQVICIQKCHTEKLLVSLVQEKMCSKIID